MGGARTRGLRGVGLTGSGTLTKQGSGELILAGGADENNSAYRFNFRQGVTRLVAGAGIHAQAGDSRATASALRRTDAVLPRIGAMDLKFTAWPRLPLPGFAPVQRTGAPLRARLRARREVRDALVAQTFLQPPPRAR